MEKPKISELKREPPREEKKEGGWNVTPEGNYEFRDKKGILRHTAFADGSKVFYEPNGNISLRIFPDGVVERFTDGIVFSRTKGELKHSLPPSPSIKDYREEDYWNAQRIAWYKQSVAIKEEKLEEIMKELKETEQRIASKKEAPAEAEQKIITEPSVKQESFWTESDKKMVENARKYTAIRQQISEKERELKETLPFRLIKITNIKKDLERLNRLSDELESERSRLLQS